MKPDELLHSVAKRQKPPARAAARLGEVGNEYITRNDRKMKKNASVIDFWEEILPGEIHEHCRLVGISRGALRVEVEPGAYMHELQTMTGELLQLLQNNCPRADIRKIILQPGRNNQAQADEQDERP